MPRELPITDTCGRPVPATAAAITRVLAQPQQFVSGQPACYAFVCDASAGLVLDREKKGSLMLYTGKMPPRAFNAWELDEAVATFLKLRKAGSRAQIAAAAAAIPPMPADAERLLF